MSAPSRILVMKNMEGLLRYFKMELKKKGLSAVVATTLLILLTVVSVGIISTFIIPFVNDSLESTSCVHFREYYKFDESFDLNCYEDIIGGKDYKFSVRARSDKTDSDKIIGFNLRFLSEGTATPIEIINGTTVTDLIMLDPTMAGGKLIIPTPSGDYSVLSYNYSSGVNYTKMEIYPIIKDDKVCDLSDSIKL